MSFDCVSDVPCRNSCAYNNKPLNVRVELFSAHLYLKNILFVFMTFFHTRFQSSVIINVQSAPSVPFCCVGDF